MALPFEKQPVSDVMTMTNEMVRRLNEYSRRIKNIEQRLERMEGRIGMMEQTVMNQMSDLKISLDKISQKILGVSERLNSIDSELVRLNKDFGKMALKSDVKKLETFIDIVNPITSKFVTKGELERAMEDRMRKKI
jgi:predicted  nucleic acid-binding Zn-ribbon protein